MSEALPDPGQRAEAQQRQAYARKASVWVAASAGTGKTRVLTDRVLALLLHGSAPARILCLTFTKAAAAEMANRINQRLSQWAICDDGVLAQELQTLTGEAPDRDRLDKARQLFARVLDAPGGMTIATIHAFCQSLLRRFPLEAGVAPHFELMDERSSEEALAAAREAVLIRARSGEDAVLAEALREVVRHVQERGFADTLGEIVLHRARIGAALAHGMDGFARALRRVLTLAPGESVASIVTAACAERACDESGLRMAARAMLANHSVHDRERGAAIAAWIDNCAARIDGFDLYLRAFFKAGGDRYKDIMTPTLAARNPGAAAALAAEAERLDRVRERRGAAETFAATLALVQLSAAILAAYDDYKKARALLDYDDLVLKARDLLRRPGVAPWVLFKLDGGLDHILIDEAQDTNPEQWEIVQLIAEEFFTGAGARELDRTIFAVGDAKQSIYSFQRADPAKFMDMRAHFEAAVEAARNEWRVVPLDVSFRSVACVLQAVDAVFAQPGANDGVALDGAAIRHDAYRRGAAGRVELWPPAEPEDGPPTNAWRAPLAQRRAREPRARLAAAIAATICGWLDRGERLDARDRLVRPGDIMVLVRRRGPFVTDLVRALKQRDVRVAGVDRMLLTEQLAVEDMIALGRFLLLPEDDLTLATVLKGPLFGFDEATLFDLAWPRQGTLWAELQRRRDERPDFARAAAELAELLARTDFAPPYELFAEILGARGGRRAVLTRLGTEAGDPLDEFLAAALAYERRHGVSLQGFLRWLEAGEVDIKRDLDQSGRDEVRVLTVHGAKGLEAPIVFLPDTLQLPPATPRLLWSANVLPLWPIGANPLHAVGAAARQEAILRRDQEYRRLLYVAMTRASDRLYVCGWRTKRNPPAGNWYTMVAAGLRAAKAEAFTFDSRPLLGEEGWAGEGVRLTTRQAARPQPDRFAAGSSLATELLPEWCWHDPPPEPSPPKPLTPSRPDEEEPAVRSPLGADLGGGFLRGQLIHRLLQALPNLDAAKREDAARRFLAQPVHGLSDEVREAVLRECLAVLARDELAELFGPHSAAEIPVVGLCGGRALSGQIDRLVVTADRVLIVDFKTMRPVPPSAADVPPLYLRQLAAYRAAIREIYPAKSVHCALLWTEGPRLMPIDSAQLDTYL